MFIKYRYLDPDPYSNTDLHPEARRIRIWIRNTDWCHWQPLVTWYGRSSHARDSFIHQLSKYFNTVAKNGASGSSSTASALTLCLKQCGSAMICSESGSSSEFSEFRIQAKIPDPCGSGSNPYYLSLFENCKQNHLKFNHKEESINYLPFYISYYSPTVHKVQNSQRNYIFTYLLFHI